jgi:hypothetical protein
VHVVALAELCTSLEAEAAALAADLGTTAYEERLKLAAGFPAIVLTAAEAAPARALYAKVRARGHRAVCCDAAAVVSSAAMVPLRRFTFEPDALVSPEVPGVPGGERLPYADILGIFRASHQTRTESRTETKSKQFSAGRALLSGGLMVTKTVTKEERHVSQEREQICYLFRTDGDTPWLLRERGTNYGGLGAEVGPSSAQNFITTMTRLRKLAPEAVYDERLMTPRNAPNRLIRTGSGSSESVGVSSASGVDLVAHLMALSIGQGRLRGLEEIT